MFSAGNAEGIPVAQVHLLMTQPRSGLNCHLISTYLCNPFQGCVIVGASLATGAPFGATRGYRHLALSGQNPEATVKIHKDKRAKRTGEISRRDNLCVAVALNASETTGYRVMMPFGQLSGTGTVRNALRQKISSVVSDLLSLCISDDL